MKYEKMIFIIFCKEGKVKSNVSLPVASNMFSIFYTKSLIYSKKIIDQQDDRHQVYCPQQ